MMNEDFDRWVNVEGPEPESVRKLFDAVPDDPELTPEREERMERRLYAALAEERRRRTRRRIATTVLGAGLALACAAGALALAMRLPALTSPAVAQQGLLSAIRAVTETGTPYPPPPLPPLTPTTAPRPHRPMVPPATPAIGTSVP
jgi:hypothetical protein